jgi:hypothetical protein
VPQLTADQRTLDMLYYASLTDRHLAEWKRHCSSRTSPSTSSSIS